MKGLDTNVLVRYLVRDDQKQAQKAASLINSVSSSGEFCYINAVVLCELVWVLESAYRYSKKEIADVIDKILVTRQFEVDRKDLVIHALREYREGKGDLADYVIGRSNRASGCDSTATFDRALRGSASFELLD
ncbi:MAG: type II toxin-antitoxin system VapC family toxin [Nitrospirae bacterium]|nr:type II toxin-antitoxin system VapC family toxin [Nitrospirota bacterium]